MLPGYQQTCSVGVLLAVRLFSNCRLVEEKIVVHFEEGEFFISVVFLPILQYAASLVRVAKGVSESAP